jgi:glucose-1-phosphate adenylyltransferase
MKVRAVILAGGEGARLGVLTAKRTKPAVPFAGKYRMIDFTLSNCVNSDIFDVMILAQYRPHSLIEHIGAGGPWDLNRDFTGGVKILTPYKARTSSDWYLGTADAVQQNFLLIKRGPPDLVLILSGDHIYTMNYRAMIQSHLQREADLTIATHQVPIDEASRYGILGLDEDGRVNDFIEKPAQPPSTQVNMGVYLFSAPVLDHALWEDNQRADSSHDFGRDILPRLVAEGKRVYAFHYDGYWADVGTVESYWQTHMDLLKDPPPIDLNDRAWIIHTRTEERSPVHISSGATIADSMIADGCRIAAGARVERSVLAPGVQVGPGAVIRESLALTDAVIGANASVEHAIIDKRVQVHQGAHVGVFQDLEKPSIAMIGKNSHVPAGMLIEPGAVIGPDVIDSDYPSQHVRNTDYVQTKRLPYEI